MVLGKGSWGLCFTSLTFIYIESSYYRTVGIRDNKYAAPKIIDIINLLYNIPRSFPRLAMIDSDLISLILWDSLSAELLIGFRKELNVLLFFLISPLICIECLKTSITFLIARSSLMVGNWGGDHPPRQSKLEDPCYILMFFWMHFVTFF